MFLSFRRSQHALLALSFFVIMVLVVFSTLLYFIERGTWDDTLGTFINSDGDPSQFAVRVFIGIFKRLLTALHPVYSCSCVVCIFQLLGVLWLISSLNTRFVIVSEFVPSADTRALR